MDKKQARQSVSELFTKPFNRERYQLFLRNLLNSYEPRDGHYTGNLIPDAFKQHIKQYWRIGKYVDPEGRELDLLIVEVKTLSKLERARSSLRNFSVNRLKQFEKEASLIAFYAEDDRGADWRFSFVKIEHEAYKDDKGKVKLKQELTPAKRYSYLVGVHENSHTASKQLLPLLEMDYADPRIEEIEAAFGIEKITDEFFDQYKLLFQKLAEHLKRQAWFKKGSEEECDQQVSRFAKKLLGQIVFLYFLQKKGWLGVAKDKAWGAGSKRFMRERHKQVIETGGNYYRDFLQYLFYEALADERKEQDDPGYYARFDCRVPFLNGGLFEADYDWQNEAIELSNTLFHNNEKTKAGDDGTGILDVFDRYNFTIKEDEPLEKEVAVDPEMLGKVFENMLEVSERRSKGAFYTPREIVHYMCQESLIHYLDNRLNVYATVTELAEPQGDIFGNTGGQQSLGIADIKVPKADLEILIRKGHLALENDTRVLVSGKETRDYKFQLPEFIRLHAKEIDVALADIKACDPAIGSGAFPVGLLHEIVNARLALAPHSGNAHGIYELKRHAIGESIYGVDIDASAIDIARLRLWLSLIVDEDDYGKIEALPNLDYKIMRGDSLLGIDDIGKVDDIFSPKITLIRDLEGVKEEFFSTTDHTKKADLAEKINALLHQISDGKKNFDFKIYFSEVWHHKGGFDIVIGNPPYVDSEEMTRQRADRDALKKLYSTARGNWDLFVPFIEKGIAVAKFGGSLSFIVPNKLISAKYADKIRSLMSRFNLHELRDYSSVNVFKEADVYPITFLLTKHRIRSENVSVVIMKGLNSIECANSVSSEFFYKNADSWSKFFFDGAIYELVREIDEMPVLSSFGVKIFGAATVDEAYKIKEILHEQGMAIAFKFINTGTIDKYASLWGRINTQYIKDTYLKPVVRYDDLNKISSTRHSQAINGKIVVAGMSQEIEAFYDSKGEYCPGKSTTIIQGNEPILPAITSILNSEVISFYVSITYHFRKMNGGYLNIGKEVIENIPISPNFINNKKFSAACTVLVSWLQTISEESRQLIFSFLKELIDGLAYELYFPKEIKAANKEILPHLGDLTPLTDTMSEEEKLAIIQREFYRLYDPRHPVRNHLDTMDSVEVVRTIRDALKRK